jgi:uncharacterized membrane protein
MNRMVVAVFPELSKALAGRDALKSLDHDKSVYLYGYAMVTKQTDGTIAIIEEHDWPWGHRTLLGSDIHSLICLLNGTAGGQLASCIANLDNAQVSADFVDQIARELTPGKLAIVADIDEEWTTWLDLPIEELGGVIYRCPLVVAREAANSTEVAAMKADLAQLKAEHAQASADRQAKLDERLKRLDATIQQRLENAKKRHEAAEAKAQAKADLLRRRAAAAKAAAQGRGKA